MAITLSFSTVASAGKEGVFLNDSVYFTLEHAVISSGAEYQTMQFNLQLNNNSPLPIDYNRYGVRVTSSANGSYYAQLIHTADGLVAPYTTANYVYIAKIAPGLPEDQLYVTLFDWNGGETRDIGSLSVAGAAALQHKQHGATLNLADVDTALAQDAFVSFQALKAFAEPVNGRWNVTVNVAADYWGTGSVTLPQALKFSIRDGRGRSYPATVHWSGEETLRAGQTSHLIVTAAIDSRPEPESATMEISRNETSGGVLARINLGQLLAPAQIGEAVPYIQPDREGLTIRAERAQLQTRLGERQVLVTVTLHNASPRTQSVPNLAGTLVADQNQLSLPATAAITPDPFIAPGESLSYVFAADVPDGVNEQELQVLVSEQPSATLAGSSGSASGASPNAESGAGGTVSIPIMAASLNSILMPVEYADAPAYTLGTPLDIDPNLDVIDKEMQVSLVDLQAHVNSDNTYKTVVAKFKFENTGTDNLELPDFTTRLSDASGAYYPGTRQTTTVEQLLPNTKYVFSYTYLMPPAVNGPFLLQVLDNDSPEQAQVPVSSYRVAVQSGEPDTADPLDNEWVFYPIRVKMENWELFWTYSGSSFTYKMNINLNISPLDDVIIDENVSSIEFELVDARDRVLGTANYKFVGSEKIISGKQSVTFASVRSDQYDEPVTVNVYESIASPTGTVKRLVAELKPSRP